MDSLLLERDIMRPQDVFKSLPGTLNYNRKYVGIELYNQMLPVLIEHIENISRQRVKN